jgi:UDP-glucose 4-epimerase
LIPRVIQAGLGELHEVEIYGDDYPTPDGTAVRDYIHVTDVAEAHVLALQHLLRGGGNCALNLGTGRGHSVREVIRTAENVSGRKICVRLKPRREGDPPSLVACSSRAAERLGWTPRRSDLETIVRTALSWEESRLSRSESTSKSGGLG